MNYLKLANSEPYRFFFPLGILFLLWGAMVWVPLLWDPGVYPVLAHRYLMLNGFAGCFIGGFLMTAVPKFSQTWTARKFEIFLLLLVTLAGLICSYLEEEKLTFIFSSLQPITIFIFLIPRMIKRKANPPYSFMFIPVGLSLWFISGMVTAFYDSESFRNLHHEGAISAIILGVGSRLIPGILGHVEIVNTQKQSYEKNVSLIKSVPLHFFLLIALFVMSYFQEESIGSWVRALILIIIGVFYWRLYQKPTERTALTWNIWTSSWLIVLSFVIKALWPDGMIHASHFLFINGIVLMSLMIGTRVLQSHGPKDKTLENSKILYLVSFLVVFAALTRVSAFLMPNTYLNHLAYSSVILILAVGIWSFKFLRYINISR